MLVILYTAHVIKISRFFVRNHLTSIILKDPFKRCEFHWFTALSPRSTYATCHSTATPIGCRRISRVYMECLSSIGHGSDSSGTISPFKDEAQTV